MCCLCRGEAAAEGRGDCRGRRGSGGEGRGGEAHRRDGAPHAGRSRQTGGGH